MSLHLNRFSKTSLLLLMGAGAPALAQDKVTYMDHVRPVFESRCMNCHNGDKKKGGLDLSTYGATLAGGSGGICVDVGDANSKLLKCVNFTAEPFMPPKSDKIPQGEIDVIAKWIQGGLLETASSVAKKKKTVNLEMASTNPQAKPEGPPPMPEHLLLEPVVVTPKPNSIKSMALNPWSPLAVVAGIRQVLLYHTDSGELLGVLPFPEGSPEKVGFSRNGSLLYAGGGTAGKKGIVAVWEVKTGKQVTVVGDEVDSVEACDLSPDHQLIALGGRSSKKVHIHRTADGSKVASIKKHTDWIMALAFSPDGVLLATGDRNGGLYVWESASGNEFYNLKGHEKGITAVAWRPDSNMVASVSEDGTCRWWEMNGGTQAKNFAPSGAVGVLSVNYGTDGSIITGGRDGKLRVFAPDGTAKFRNALPLSPLVMQAGFTPDMKRIYSGSLLGEACFWDGTKETAAPLLTLGVNPPSIASRIDTIQKELTEKQAALAQTQAAAAEKEKLMAATKAEMESMQKMIADMDAQQKKAASIKDQVAKATESLQASKTKFAAQLDAAKKSLETLKSPTPESSVIPSGMSVALVSSLQEASQAQAAMRELSTALTETKIRDLEEILKNHAAQIALMQKKLPETDAAMASYAAKIKETQDAMPAKQLAFDTAAKLFQEAKAGMDQIGGIVGGIQKGMNRWLAARENSTVVKLQNETEKLKETVEDLKSEIPTIEAEIKTLTDKKAATPPPTPEELAAIDKKLASHAKRIPEAKQELATAEAGLAEKASSHQVALKKYQEMLPK